MCDTDELLETFKMLREALLANDVLKLDELMAKDYIGYDPLGSPQNKRVSIDAYKPGSVNLDRYDVEDMTARVIGEVGVITGKGYIHGMFDGCEFSHDLRFLDLYIISSGRWQLYLSHVTPLGTT